MSTNPVAPIRVMGGQLQAFGVSGPVAIGKGGFVDPHAKREGDGGTPLGLLPIRGALLRPDRIAAPVTVLPWRWLRPHDGWSDDPQDPCYNRPVAHPHPFSAERLWREDHLYDIILVLGWNDAPVMPHRGSAIFWHACAADGGPTEGCIACPPDRLQSLLPRLRPGMQVEVLPA